MNSTKRKNNGGEALLKDTMFENFPDLYKNTMPQIQEPGAPRKINKNKSIPRYIAEKLHNTTDKR